MVRCVQCDTELVAPVRSEYWSDKHACHIWHCAKCCACFSSLVSFFRNRHGVTEGYPERGHYFRRCWSHDHCFTLAAPGSIAIVAAIRRASSHSPRLIAAQ
jgi:hypothetical protein